MTRQLALNNLLRENAQIMGVTFYSPQMYIFYTLSRKVVYFSLTNVLINIKIYLKTFI